jgi:sugar phosphate isomerase/epimerase
VNRRTFLKTATTAVTVLAGASPGNALSSEKPLWLIGCFNRAWSQWSYDTALDGMAAAGYKLTGLISAQPGEAFTGADATPEYLEGLKQRIAKRGLAANVTSLRFHPDAPLAESIADVRKQIENAARLELKFLLTFGVDQSAHYENFYRLMSDAAAQAEKRGVQIVMKPHGGVSAASGQILRCLERVGHQNFKIWYDAGNIVYYTGKDPVAELDPIARHVTGFCAKDCPGPKGEVMSPFGAGKVDFKAILGELKSTGFSGPIMVEGIKVGATAEETTANARANREFLEKTLASI